jgi:hypothetical protein
MCYLQPSSEDGRVISLLQYSQIASCGLKHDHHAYHISDRACTATEYIIFAVFDVRTKQGWDIKKTRRTILKTKFERIQPHFLRLEWVMYPMVIYSMFRSIRSLEEFMILGARDENLKMSGTLT